MASRRSQYITICIVAKTFATKYYYSGWLIYDMSISDEEPECNAEEYAHKRRTARAFFAEFNLGAYSGASGVLHQGLHVLVLY